MPRIALVTGAARGIGAAIARVLAPDHQLVLTYRSSGPELDAIVTAHPETHLIEADLAEPEAPARIIAEVIQRHGRIDVLVNNAATVAETPWDETPDPAAYVAQFAVNSTAPALLIAGAAPHMASGSAIVNITSVNALRAPLSAPAYAASKGALEVLTASAARALGPQGIRVNAVSPGFIERDYAPRPEKMLEFISANTPLGRPGTPDEIAATVRFLASDEASYVTGETLTVSGGYHL